ncbi:MAG: hypothetical protein DI623_08285 [Sphingomonas sanxanigenens]|uniref:Glycosyl transferase n=1 Tax=Sphingomonas sanxanigenens TaxID=397260 RepID=A0A2W5C4D7_9SPHN|nr:MAG: hypothetical protein DI623_08285 [Sphingomonas sanxanigenens]
MRVCFLFNHDQIHQIAHSLPVALALAGRPDVQVVIAATNIAIMAEIRRLADPAQLARAELVALDLESAFTRGMASLLDGFVPARKILIYRDNLDFFRALDMLVVTERTSLILKRRYALHDLRMVLIDHGAGDRAIGFGASASGFDQLLVAGPKIRDRMVIDAGVDPARISIVGYPKFDLAPAAPMRLPMRDNGRPTVLYNPHLSPHLSSWFGMGRRVLDYFLQSDRYNLIFAPHIMLFNRRMVTTIDRLRIAFPGGIAMKYFAADNIHIDLGSHYCTDMSYVGMADLYLGDVSSQVYEFMRKRRPCIFLNAHGIDYQGDPNFSHWSAGEVIDKVDDLGPALDRAWALHESRYAAAQDRLFDYTFDIGAEPSAARAARAILETASA